MPKKSNKWIRIESSDIDQLGAFAKRKIPPETAVAEYTGKRISKEEATRQIEAGNVYVFCLDDDYDIDGDDDKNLAKYCNHSCAPNCETRYEDDAIWIYSIKTITPGEEITINYGFDLTDYKDHPCRCGAPDCVGYIVDDQYFDQLRRQARYRKKGK